MFRRSHLASFILGRIPGIKMSSGVCFDVEPILENDKRRNSDIHKKLF